LLIPTTLMLMVEGDTKEMLNLIILFFLKSIKVI